MEKAFFSTPELAEWVGVFHTTVRRWIEQGRIKGVRVGRNYKIPAEEVIRVLDHHDIPLPEGLTSYKAKLTTGVEGPSHDSRQPGSILQKLLVGEDIEDPALVCRRASILGGNQAFADLAGYSQTDLIGVDITEVIQESRRESLVDFAQRCLEQPRKGSLHYTAHVKTDRGRRKKVRITAGSLDHMKGVFLLIIRQY